MKKQSSKVPASQIHPAYYDDPAPVEIPRDRGGTWIILGLLFLVSTVVLWREISRLETAGGALRVTWMVVEAYEWGGKWVPIGITLFCGIGFCIFGLLEWLSCRKYDEANDD